MLKDAATRRFDVLMFWSIDWPGRSTTEVAAALADLEAAGLAIQTDKEAVDANDAARSRHAGNGGGFHRAGAKHDPVSTERE
jgi:glycosyltransferase A (GT-A) superfamily protein (DUF2064 family)